MKIMVLEAQALTNIDLSSNSRQSWSFWRDIVSFTAVVVMLYAWLRARRLRIRMKSGIEIFISEFGKRRVISRKGLIFMLSN